MALLTSGRHGGRQLLQEVDEPCVLARFRSSEVQTIVRVSEICRLLVGNPRTIADHRMGHRTETGCFTTPLEVNSVRAQQEQL